MGIIDLNRIREALPNRSIVKYIKYKDKSPAIECKVVPRLSDDDFEMCKQWQREIIGNSIVEFYTEETGSHWYVFIEKSENIIIIQ